MCGIPMQPTPDAARGKKLTFEAVCAHLGGFDRMLTDEMRGVIDGHVKHYLWKYPDGTCWCTACREEVGDVRARHKSEISCPRCRQAAEFRHVARGHSKVFDEFDLHWWRRSVIDPERVIFTVTQVWRDSTIRRPEDAPLHVKPTAVYLFKLGEPVTTYKNHSFFRDGDAPHCWSLQKDVHPENTFAGRLVPSIDDMLQMRQALHGTGVGRVYEAVSGKPYIYDDLRIVANCAARPWLEYLVKCGQAALAESLKDRQCVSPEIVPKPRARTPRELLGLTEGQWYEVRRDRIALNEPVLVTLRAMQRMGYRAAKISEAAALSGYAYAAQRVSPPRRLNRAGEPPPDSIDALTRGLPDKLRRAVFRSAVQDDTRMSGIRSDYYRALRTCGEDMRSTALLLPKNLMEMHDRYTHRAALIAEREKAEALRAMEMRFRPTLERLRARYGFTACGLTLRPYESAAEVFAEGRVLGICIGTYAERYLKGDKVICCLRRCEEPDEPFHAVEFSATTGRRIQDRGAGNRMTQTEPPGVRRQIQMFWRQYDRRLRAK